MLDKMKQIYEFQKKAREIQKHLEDMKVEQMEGGVTLCLNGLFKVESLQIDPSLMSPDRKEKLESTLKKLFSETALEVQKRSAASSADFLKGLSL